MFQIELGQASQDESQVEKEKSEEAEAEEEEDESQVEVVLCQHHVIYVESGNSCVRKPYLLLDCGFQI